MVQGDFMSDQLANWNTERVERDPYDNHAEVRNAMGNSRRGADPYRDQYQANQEVITNSYTDQQYAGIDDVFQEMETQQQDEEHQSGVMYEAQARIEQANLYQTLLTHELFGPGSARQNILEKVQTEVKDFVLVRLEELLGMKSSVKEVAYALPFDDEEVSALKALATKVLRRETNQNFTPEVRQVNQAVVPASIQVRPVAKTNPALQPSTIKAAPTLVKKTQAKPASKKPTTPVKPLTAEEMATMTPERAAELVASRGTKKGAESGRGKPRLTIEQLQRVEQEQAQRSAMNLGRGTDADSVLIGKAIAASLK